MIIVLIMIGGMSWRNNFMENNNQKAIFAAGCFWGIQKSFDSLDGVLETTVGYIGGKRENPSYEQVCIGATGHAEAIEIIFDSEKISYIDLLNHFFEIHDPTQIDRQGPDVGSQYRSEIFYTDSEQKETAENLKAKLNSEKFDNHIATAITSASEFYPAEEYHQKYLEKNGANHC